MLEQSPVALVSRQRAILAVGVAALLVVFNRSRFGSPIDAAIAAVGFLVVGYLTLTVADLILDRFVYP
ncbi:hypothetical protein HTZ84_03635 [Haloterrigena sp. SYSU A558-1]|uniref:Uncharacterized protein n=1 Tax=Haloterrigena gelatinilytica TaxID=2741724 RepID=A0A8J8GN34_9EURY|nr:hypothetical protein [Haloterrigena gelatinilytica]NUB92676.1 hypothetical protein [Haloterrigena gelatinilytica]NUC71408.1 hypothetical protein [Haloterrigena gelatinilytica]